MRLTGLNYVLQNFQQSIVSARVWPESLVLGAWVIHAINALHRRPDDRQASLSLLDVVTYHVPRVGEDDSSNDEYDDQPPTVPVGYAQGLFFIGDIVLDDYVWRLHRTARMIPLLEEHLPRMYQCGSRHEIEHRLGHGSSQSRSKVHPQRVANRQTHTEAVELIQTERAVEDLVQEFALLAAGVEVAPKLAISGDDINVEGPDDDHCDPDALMQLIWRQVPSDIFKTSPNRKSATAAAHTLLSADQRDSATWQLFQSLDLTEVFPHAYIYRSDARAWASLFNVYFPPKGSPPLHPGAQNWGSMTYYGRWKDLMSRVSSDDSARIRRDVKVLFDTMKWLPNAKSDRLWQTKTVKSKNVKFYPEGGALAAAPHIAINASLVGREPIILGVLPVAGEDEDAGEDN